MNAAEEAAGDTRVTRRTTHHLHKLQAHACATAVDTCTLASVEQDGRALRRAALAGSTARLLHLAEDIEAAGAARRIRLAQLRGEQPPPGPGEHPDLAGESTDPDDRGEWVFRLDTGVSLGTLIGKLLEVEGLADTDTLQLVAARPGDDTGTVELVFVEPPTAAETDPDDRPLPLPVPVGTAHAPR